MKWIFNLFKKPKPQVKRIDWRNVENFDVGDKVGFSDYAIQEMGGNPDFHKKAVFEVVDKEVAMMTGVRLTLHTGTTLMNHQAKKLPKETPLFT